MSSISRFISNQSPSQQTNKQAFSMHEEEGTGDQIKESFSLAKSKTHQIIKYCTTLIADDKNMCNMEQI